MASVRAHENRFPLLGAHAAVECEACHKSAAVGQFEGLSTDCSSCHLSDFQKTNNPSHSALNFPTTCQTCHLFDSWLGAKFDHLKFTGYALTGAHATLDCLACHVGGKYQGTPTDCYSCHVNDFNGTTNPPHVSSGIPTTCAECHSTAAWQPATFDHSKTAFPLTGAHVSVPCSSCHINGNFTSTPTDCYSCHTKDYNNTTNPAHAASGIPTTCVVCHNTSAWQPATFDHSKTSFPLTGAHVSVACASCHVNNNYTTLPTDCYGCHKADYNSTTNPPHASAGFPTTCLTCHSTTSWTTATFDHSTTGFPLTGTHTTIQCSACHVNNNYSLNDPTCKACHMPDYNSTNNPPHATAGFPVTCDTCHSTVNWSSATFNHNLTAFPLTGAHVSVPCTSCHINNNYTTVPTDCYSCHVADYNGTTNPNHRGAGYPTTCATCHTTTSWAGATFNHTYFRIPHHNAQCTDCHINSSNYVIFSCTANCHAQNETNGDHRGVNGYSYGPTTCYNCHRN